MSGHAGDAAETGGAAWLELSAAQRAVWFDLQLGASPLGYLLGGWACIDHALDVDLARQAVSLVMARHDALRLRVDGGAPRQRLVDGGAPPVTVTDLSQAADPEAAFQDFAAAAFATALALGEAPLLHVDLVRVGPARWYALWRCHHVIMDSMSVAILLARWTEAYVALSGEGDGELAAPGGGFLPVLAADAAYRAGPKYAVDLAYWRARLEGAPAVLFEPAAARPAGEAVAQRWRLAGEDYAAFAAACRAGGVTTQRGLAALLALALARSLGRWDLVLGLALHRRDFETRETIGMFAGVLPVRCTMDPAASLAENIRAAAAALERDFRHQRMPVDVVARALGRAAHGGGPLFDVVISHLSRGAAPAAAQFASAVYRGPERTPLALYATEFADPGCMEFELNADPEIVDALACGSLATALRCVMAAFVIAPDCLADEVVVLDAGARALMAGWNDTALAVPCGSLGSLFAVQARRTPDAAAVEDGGRALSYTALDAASDRLAAALQARGVGLETVVGVALPRSLETVVAVLAILKAGGVYLPLDPAYPAARLEFMLRDAAAALVVTDAGLAAMLPGDVPLLVLGGELPAGVPVPVALRGESLAYVVYTSGSTGVPKGVAVSHAAAANLAFARRAGHDPIGPGDRVLAAISVGFDVSIGQILLPLLAGACVVVAPDLRTLSAAGFWALMAERRVSHVNSVPSFIDSVCDAAGPGVALRRLMLGGEVLTGALCRRLRQRLPGVEIVNMYGPTEACIDAAAYVVPEDAGDGPLPIGRPLGNDRAYVLDARLRPVPPGVAGELCLGGAGVARGYVGQAALTAERFVPDPFGPPGSRMYRTGDRASWRADGTLCFHGRSDAQVKIRGFRVELGEIEAALQGHPAVMQAAVALQGARLVGYVVCGGDMPPAEDLRAYLAERLPGHMVPALFLRIDALPLTQNGKLDRAALPAPESAPGAPGAPRRVARDAAEAALQRVWQDVLGVAEIGLDEDFFEAGGNSLLAMMMIGRCNEEFGVALPVAAIFEYRTVAAMAAALRECSDAGGFRFVTLRAGSGDVAPLLCVHPQGGGVFCYMKLAAELPPELPVLGVQDAGLEGGAGAASVEAMAADYIAALRAATPCGPYRLLGYSFGGLVAFEMARQLEAAGESVAFLGMFDVPWPEEIDSVPDAAMDDEVNWLPGRVADVHAHAARIGSIYRPRAAVRAAVLQVRAIRRDGVPADWARFFDGAVETLDVDCSHDALMDAGVAPQLAARVARHLAGREAAYV